MIGGTVDSGTGTLTLGGNLTTMNDPNTATINGNLSLGGTSRTFLVNPGAAIPADLRINATISGGATSIFVSPGFTKAGGGVLFLTATNTYNGTTTINEGQVVVLADRALGATTTLLGASAGTVVNGTGNLFISGVQVTNEDLTINSANPGGAFNASGASVWTGDILLNTDTFIASSGSFLLNGPITGVGGFTKLGTDPEIVVRYNKDASAMESVVAHEAVHSLTHPSFVSAAAKAANTVVVNPDGTIKLPTANMIEGVASHEAQKVVPGAQPYPEEARIVAAIEQEMSSNRFNPSDALRKAVYGGDPAAIARFMQLAGEASPGSSSAGVTSTALAASTTPQDPSRRGLDSFLQRIASERNANNPSGYSDIYRLYNRPTTPQSFEGAPEAQLEKAEQYLTSLQHLIAERPAGNENNSLSQNHAPSSSSEVIQDILDQGTALRAGDFFHYLSADAPDSVSHRVYINASIDHAPEIMAFVVKDIVDSPDEKFRGVDSAKIASPASAGRRNENIVIYVDSQRTQQNVLQELAAYHDANPDHFAPEIPALTEPVRPGIAIADEPSPSMVQTLNDKLGQSKPDYSFGESRAIALHLAYTDAVNASGNGTVDPATFAEKAAERFAELGIDPNDPSKNLPETGSDQAMSPQLSSPQSPSVSPASAETQAIPDVAGQAPRINDTSARAVRPWRSEKSAAVLRRRKVFDDLVARRLVQKAVRVGQAGIEPRFARGKRPAFVGENHPGIRRVLLGRVDLAGQFLIRHAGM